MAFRLNKAILESSSFLEGELLLFALPAKGAHALLSMAEVLTYDATWVNDSGARSPLTDSQRAIIDATISGLMEIEQVNKIATAIEESTVELLGIKSELALMRASIDAHIAASPPEFIEDELQDVAGRLLDIAVLLGV